VRHYLSPKAGADSGVRARHPGPEPKPTPQVEKTIGNASPPRPAAAKTTTQPKQTPDTITAPKNGQKSIFVIEDSKTSRKVLSMVLGRNNYHIYEAETGDQALALARKIEPDLVLLDVMLPDMTGYDILPQLRQLPHFAELPVIMLTGKSAATDRMKGMLVGTNEYLTKPFNPEKLISVIRNYI